MLEGLLKQRLLGLTLKVSHSVGQRWDLRLACLTGSQGMLMLLVRGPQL